LSRLFVALILAAEVVALAVLVRVAPWMVLALAPVVPLTLVAVLLLRWALGSTTFRTCRLSPGAIASYRRLQHPAKNSPEELSRSIVERAEEISRALAESPSEIRVEMCALGYRACANDMITLTHLTNEELPYAGFLRRMKLRRLRKRATDALAAARAALPPGALRTTRQEHQ
jgi:hypothetical protein